MRNPSLAILLMNEACRVIACSYEKDKDGKGVAPYTLFKTFQDDLKVGDLVIVPTTTRYGFTSVRVEVLDAEWSPDETKPIAWIVGRVETAGYNELRAKEARAVEAIDASEKRAKRKEMAAKLTEHLNETEKAALLIAPPAPAAE